MSIVKGGFTRLGVIGLIWVMVAVAGVATLLQSMSIVPPTVQASHLSEAQGELKVFQKHLAVDDSNLGPQEAEGALLDASSGRFAVPAATRGSILVDNHIDTTNSTMGHSFDDAQGFTTGPGHYRLTGVEITVDSATSDGAISVAISEPTVLGRPGTTLYELEAPSDLSGKLFFSAPEYAYLAPNSEYLVRIDITSGYVTIKVTVSTDESELGLPGWSIEDHSWTSSGPTQGLNWTMDGTRLYAITVRGTEVRDRFGENRYTAGTLQFSRHTGESPTMNGVIIDGTDTDWFKTSLSFDYGGRYRVDVKPVAMSNDDDIYMAVNYFANLDIDVLTD